MSTNVIQMPGTLPQWTFADRLRKVRRDRGMSQVEFADALGIKSSAYEAWESGRNKPSDLADIAVKLEGITGVPRAWFLGWMDGGSPAPGGHGASESGRRDSNSQHSACDAVASVVQLRPGAVAA